MDKSRVTCIYQMAIWYRFLHYKECFHRRKRPLSYALRHVDVLILAIHVFYRKENKQNNHSINGHIIFCSNETSLCKHLELK